MPTTKEQLHTAKRYLESAIQELDAAPSQAAIADLLKAIRSIDAFYKEWCDALDDDYGDDTGTTYANGASMEFYIESDWWHAVSVELRKLDK